MKIVDYKSPLPEELVEKDYRFKSGSKVNENLASYLNYIFLKKGITRNAERFTQDVSVSALKRYEKDNFKNPEHISVANIMSVSSAHDVVKLLSSEMLINVSQLLCVVLAGKAKSQLILGESSAYWIDLQKEADIKEPGLKKMFEQNLGEGLVFTGFKEHPVSFTPEALGLLKATVKEIDKRDLLQASGINGFHLLDILIGKKIIKSPVSIREIATNLKVPDNKKLPLYKEHINNKISLFIKEISNSKQSEDILLQGQAKECLGLLEFLNDNKKEVEDVLVNALENYHKEILSSCKLESDVYLKEVCFNLPGKFSKFKENLSFLTFEEKTKEFNFIKKEKEVITFIIDCQEYTKYQINVNKAFSNSEAKTVEGFLSPMVSQLNNTEFETISEVNINNKNNNIEISFVKKCANNEEFKLVANKLLQTIVKADWRKKIDTLTLHMVEKDVLSEDLAKKMRNDLADKKTNNNLAQARARKF